MLQSGRSSFETRSPPRTSTVVVVAVDIAVRDRGGGRAGAAVCRVASCPHGIILGTAQLHQEVIVAEADGATFQS